MEPKDYIVTKIEGEYAILREKETKDAALSDDEPITGEPLFIALALLPEGTDVGTHLHYEMHEYTIVEE